MINYEIGEYYQYPCNQQKFKLSKVINSIFHFECGHWCTDNVFIELLQVEKTTTQLKLL